MPQAGDGNQAGDRNANGDRAPVAARHASGHRQRLRDRFLKAGPDGLADYELLELLLFMAIPRRDVKPLAKDLIARFGSYGEVLAAEVAELRGVDGLGDTAIAAIKAVEASVIHLTRESVVDRPVISSWDALLDYVRAAMARGRRERFRVLFLDRKNVMIADEVQGEGTIDHTPVYPREVVKRALELGASAVILVHNHPSGDPSPSKGDIAMTRELVDACKRLDIRVHDHLVVGRKGHRSFKSMGLL
ncbi:RadC family protein [Yunchengibacter salinarum]|uniref:RadC family protein n=1 Tax=Yunchengibacter salinarum TaxID=3133399 RepID=UPI0035B691E7